MMTAMKADTALNGITAPPIPGELPKGFSDDITSVETLTWHETGKPSCCLYTVRGGGHVPQRAYRFPRLLGKVRCPHGKRMGSSRRNPQTGHFKDVLLLS
jgi:hypothetical protein